MASMGKRNFLRKFSLELSHLPTVLLAVGYVMFWVELYILHAPIGKTSLTAWILFSALAVFFLVVSLPLAPRFVIEIKKWWSEQNGFKKCFVVLVGLLALAMILIGAMASVLPPHLPQEYDSLNYHMTIPRQHLIQGSFTHLSWSVADLFLLPLDHAIAPFSLSTPWPNKIAFFFFILGILGVATQLTWRFSKKNIWACIAVAMAILGAHGLSIQMGIAMFDVIMLYLFLAAIHSVLSGNWVLAALEFTFYFWSKSFVPLQVCALAIALGIIFLIAKKNKWQFVDLGQAMPKMNVKTFFLSFIVFSLLIGGPFAAKSLYYTGTPLYPFSPGVVSTGVYRDKPMWNSVVERSQQCVSTKDQYGQGRGVQKLIEHFWILAVPEKDVNNRFDYPLGLSYLLILAPFGFLLIENLRKRKIDLISWFCILYWASWWFGSQQSRFLYIPLVLMFIVVLSDGRFLRWSMLAGLFVAVGLSAVSVARAHQADLFRTPEEMLRGRDKDLIAMSRSVDRSKPVVINFEDAAFADFVVEISRSNSVFVFPGGNR